jgi:hypothetical protein
MMTAMILATGPVSNTQRVGKRRQAYTVPNSVFSSGDANLQLSIVMAKPLYAPKHTFRRQAVPQK